MRRIKWKKWMMLVMAAGLLYGQSEMTAVQAEELLHAGTEETAGLSDMETGGETANPGQREDAGPSEGMFSKVGTVAWEVDGDTMVIFGEGILEGTALETMREALDGVAHVRFENCKLHGSMSGWFENLQKLKSVDLSGLDTSQVTDMSRMFARSSQLINLNISGIDTSQVTDMSDMFWGCPAENLDVSGFETSQVTDMSGMFYYCSSRSLDVSKFNTSQVIDMKNMFGCCYYITNLDVCHFDTSNVTDMSGMFGECQALESLDVSGFDTSNVTDMSSMFGCMSLEKLDVSNFDTSQVTDMSNMFSNCGLDKVDVSNFNTSQVTDMHDMFRNCSGLISLDVSAFDTSQVTDMSGMFAFCYRLTDLDVSGFDTSKVTDMSIMFGGGNGMGASSALTSLDVSGFNTKNVTNMDAMFSFCGNLESLNVSGFDTSQVTNMCCMFGSCKGLKSLDVSGFDTSKVTDMSQMFSGCEGIVNLDVSNFDTSQVTDMYIMFQRCSGLTKLDLSNFDLSKIDTANEYGGVRQMFENCRPALLNTPKVLPAGGFIELDGSYYNPDGVETQVITEEFLSTALTLEGGTPVPTPTPAPIPTPTPIPTPGPNTPGQDKGNVSGFVSRMYTVALNRDAEETGLNDWTNRLLTHEIDGAGIAHGFIMSNEFQNRNLSDGDFVDVLYRTFFDREADEGGRNNWLSELAAGRTRGYVLSGFVNSVEFDNLCDSFGIARGTMKEDGSPCNPGIRGFVERCYTKVLDRNGEKAGVEDWTNRIASGQMSAEDVAKSFFFSDEYTGKNTDNETFVETLYQTFMDRSSDAAGKADWVGRLNSGMGRQEVLEGFSRSEEFAGILAGYGL